jgi:hypothetical protein
MNNDHIEVCPACGVKIEGDRVLFSAGPAGTRARLWARVCQYAKKPGCINTDETAIGPVTPTDHYGDLEETLPTLPKTPAIPPLAAVVSGIQQSIEGE